MKILYKFVVVHIVISSEAGGDGGEAGGDGERMACDFVNFTILL